MAQVFAVRDHCFRPIAAVVPRQQSDVGWLTSSTRDDRIRVSARPGRSSAFGGKDAPLGADADESYATHAMVSRVIRPTTSMAACMGDAHAGRQRGSCRCQTGTSDQPQPDHPPSQNLHAGSSLTVRNVRRESGRQAPRGGVGVVDDHVASATAVTGSGAPRSGGSWSGRIINPKTPIFAPAPPAGCSNRSGAHRGSSEESVAQHPGHSYLGHLDVDRCLEFWRVASWLSRPCGA
jgi:hypothetical protein